MSIIWKPNGAFNLSEDPSNLPQEINQNGTIVASDALSRCKNLRVDTQGVLRTRDGATKFNASAIDTSPHLIVEQGGNRYTFAGTKVYKNESSIGTGLTNAKWSAIKYNPYNSSNQNIFALNGTDRKRIESDTVYEWGIDAPTVAPVIVAGASTGLTGDYNAKYSYCRKEGTTVVCESNLSPAAGAAVTLADGSLSITATAPSDSQVTHIRFYRTLTGGTDYYHDQDLAVGSTNVDSDTSDGALGDVEETDHFRPPLGHFVIGPNYNGVCFILLDNKLYYCKAKQPEYWPLTYYVEVGSLQDPARAAVFYAGQLYVLTQQNKIFLIQGTGSNTFFPVPMDALTGTQSVDCALSVHGEGLFHLGPDALYVYAGQDRNFSEAAFLPIFRGTTTNGVPGIDSTKLSRCMLVPYHGYIYFFYCSTTDTYPSNCLVFHIGTKRAGYYSWSMQFRVATVDQTNNKLLAADTSGYVWQIENKSATDDGGTAISFEAESKSFVLQTRRNFPRWCKYDVDASNADSCTGKIIVDGSTLQSHTLSENRKTKRRLITTGNGRRSSVRISGTGPVSIYATEME